MNNNLIIKGWLEASTNVSTIWKYTIMVDTWIFTFPNHTAYDMNTWPSNISAPAGGFIAGKTFLLPSCVWLYRTTNEWLKEYSKYDKDKTNIYYVAHLINTTKDGKHFLATITNAKSIVNLNQPIPGVTWRDISKDDMCIYVYHTHDKHIIEPLHFNVIERDVLNSPKEFVKLLDNIIESYI